MMHSARTNLVSLCVAVAMAGASGCSPASDAEGKNESTLAELSSEQAIRGARDFVVRSGVDSLVYLDSARVVEVESIWRVTFRRRAMVVPNVVTVDVDRRTGAMRFPGDE